MITTFPFAIKWREFRMDEKILVGIAQIFAVVPFPNGEATPKRDQREETGYPQKEITEIYSGCI